MEAESIKSVVRELGADKVRVDHRNVWIRCPFAPWRHERGTDSKPSCSIKIVDDGPSPFLCWSCRESGYITDMVYRLNRLRGGEHTKLLGRVEDAEDKLLLNSTVSLADRLEGEYREGTPLVGTTSSIKTPYNRLYGDEELERFEKGVPEYVLERGIELDTCRDWQLLIDNDEWDPRLVFPVRCWEGDLVGFVGRRLRQDRDPKYKNYPGFDAEHFLYGEHLINPLDESEHPIILVEGMLDVLWLYQHGIGRPLGLIGSKLTSAKVAKIQAFTGARAVMTLFDGDKSGDRARKDVERMLAPCVPVLQYEPPRGADPQDMDPGEIRSLFGW